MMTTHSPLQRERAVDPARLVRWLEHTLGGPATWRGRAPGASHAGSVFDVGREGRRVVVRAQPQVGPFLDYDIMREARLLEHLAAAGVPVPEVLGASTDESVCGAPFVVLEWVDGDVLRPDAARRLPEERRRRVAAEVVRIMAAIHGVALPDVVAADASGSSTRRVLDVHGRILDEVARADVLVLELARTWLERRRHDLPEDAAVLVHGDLRLGNLVWRGDEVVACLDWETAHGGSRWFDLTWACMGAVRDDDLVLGLVGRKEFLELYADAVGVELVPRALSWWQVATAWVRGCTEARLLDLAVRCGGAGVDPARSLVWEFGSHRTDQELLSLMQAHDARWRPRARG